MPLTNLTSPISFYPSVCFRQNKIREGPPVCGFQHLAGAMQTSFLVNFHLHDDPALLTGPGEHQPDLHALSLAPGEASGMSALHWALHFVKHFGQLHRVWIRCSTYAAQIFTPHHPGGCVCRPLIELGLKGQCALIRKTVSIYAKQELPEKTPLQKQTYLGQL